MLIFVRPSVRSVQTCLEQSIFSFLGHITLREQSEHSNSKQSGQRVVIKHSESIQSIKIRVIQSEPKILRLVYTASILIKVFPCIVTKYKWKQLI